jgi:ferredoxin
MDVTDIQNKLEKIFEHGIWENFSKACIGCGICTYLCPTCHCFDIHDESTIKRGGRIRVWDSCMYPEFTLQASGYNPRPTRKNRLRNRIYHKFYSFPCNNDLIACTGCGRCINMCPVNIDIIEIINQAREVSK